MKLCPSLLVALLLLVGGSSRSAAAPDKRDLSTNFLIERLEEFLREEAADNGDNAAASVEEDDPSAGSGDLEGSDETFFETRGGGVLVSRLSVQLPSQCAASTTNIAQGRPAEQSSLAHGGAPGRAVDGNNNRQWSGNSCTHTNNENQPWWRVDLGSSKCVDRVVVTNRQDCCSERLQGFKVYIGDNPNVAANPTCGGAQSVSGKMTISVDCGGRTGRYVGIALPGTQPLTLCEVQVFGGAVFGIPAPLPPQCGPGQDCEQPGEYISLGCWRDTGDRAIPTLEGSDPRLDGPYQNRQDAIRKCYNVAKDRGFSYFAVQNGGWCASSPIAGETYQKYGRSSTCGNDGEGGPWGNEVYKITDARPEIVSLGCWRDTADRAIPTMEGSDARLDGSYQARQDAINKCSKLAKARGFNFFAVQNGGWCASSATAGQTYRKYGPSTSCKTDGEGGPWGNQVYQITGSSACVAPLDLFLLLDGSGSVGTANFDKVKQFAADVVNSFDVSPTATRVGVAQYSDRNSLVFNLGDHADKPSTVSAINGISYQRGGTKTGAALEFVRQNAAWRGGAVPKVMIVLTDGKSGDAVAAPSQSLAADGVAVYAIGVGNFDHAELLQIANSDQDKVIELTDFNALATKIDDIAKVVCSSVSDGCPSGYKSHSGICYKAFNTKKTFVQASKACYADGGTLAMPRDAATNAFIKSLKDDVDPSGFFWFGLVDQHQENEWVWIDGRPLGSFSDWKPGEPNNAGDEDFAEYFPTQWNDVGGNAKNRKFICQVIPIDCPEGYVYHPPSRMCYKAFDVKKNNEGAIEACSADGGSLAMPGDATTNVFLIYLKNAVDNKALFRFGLTDEHEEGGWMRADGIALGNFQPWGPGEPNNLRNEDCAEYFPGSHPKNKRNKWNDGPCANQNRKFICQVVPKDCPKGYKQSGASCYKAFDTRKNHDEAAKICRAEGGSLAMPQDQATNDFLVNLKNEVDGTSWFWLGADDKNDEGTWQYADGEPFGSYRNWFPGEPNQAGGNEDCLMMFESPRNMWNDQGCATKQKFICQIKMPIVDSCGGNVPGEVGVIVSPGYPVTYTDHQKCSWNIMARPGKVITVIFDDFGLESTFDTVTVEDACSGKELGKFSGSTLPAAVPSTDKQIRVIFTTDHSVTERGFKLRYFASDPSGKRAIAEPMPAQLPDEALQERDQEEPADNTNEGMLLETLKILEEDLRNAGNELE
ncbi:uncharacterized protein LOC118431996 [Branchiostoma floridae]|uniref:Uncharacterized protein LOC118431996 n=1 Tax=Branchiostoma floridae TaxID=7739 RepID=A0A9J7MDU9_BRAFL|nr:uncharacterized protein LOC118431996 [Branchiostoma floridae]